ncbi:carboxymuconolactone decarboxylase family protein [uncultured Erythrobacter sp.]|uniref:carboxymuconolactone decarboxylase family protein n=1 Tax=uncultured Erythrobacter sp. TaxID=263913 RepID=UPI0026171EE2|nr:carboxymuconolactone decarboxylase family protein [uncultured Erythrobacter sp.]
MSRIPTASFEDLSEDQQRVYNAIKSGPRGVVQGPLKVWLESPELADKSQALGAFCRYDTTLPPRLSELAIIITGAHWQAGFEWHVHAPIALEAGIDPAAVDAIREGREPVLAKQDEQVVYAFTTQLLRNREVSDETYAKAVDVLSYRSVVDLVGILGYYGLISMTIKAFEVPVPEGSAEPFASA